MDTHLVGGKGANLGELLRAGFPVPPGFAIVAGTYRELLEANQLDSEIRSILATTDFEDHASLAQTTTVIRDIINSSQLPSELVAEIEMAYQDLGADIAVAVRSSSALPDLAITSFPGQMDTYYNVTGTESLLRHIKMCWASYWSTRATANRWNKGIDHFALSVSVLVQRMVEAEYSGVAFTANPVSGEPELIIEAMAGLGEALVSGRVDPERFVLAKDSSEIRSKPPLGTVPVAVVEAIAPMALQIESHYGTPQDIEWAYAGGQVYVLQSRRILAISSDEIDYSGLERWNKPQRPEDEQLIWTRAWSDEVLTRAITPLFYSVQADLITATYDFIAHCYGTWDLMPMRVMRFHKNRGYFSTRYLMESLRYVPRFARGEDALKFFTPEQKQRVERLPFRAWKKLRSEFRLALRFRRYSFTRCHKTYYETWLPELLRRVQELDSLDLSRAGPAELEQYYWGMDRLIKEHCRPIGVGVMVHTFASISLLTAILQRWCGRPDAAAILLSGLPGNRTAEANRDTWNLACEIRESTALVRIFAEHSAVETERLLNETEEGRICLEKIRAFARRYDFRGAEDREISFPRWGDDPRLLIEILKVFIRGGDQTDPETIRQRNAERRDQVAKEILQELSQQSWSGLKSAVFRFLLQYAQIYSLFRENQRFEIDRVFYGQRKAFLAIAGWLTRHARLRSNEDIWFLSKEEVFEALAGKGSVEELQRKVVSRRAEYRRYVHQAPPMFLQGGKEFEAAVQSASVGLQGDRLHGVAASAGSAAGPARVVRDMRELHRVQAGDILVTNSTDPGWTPVFLLIRGLVLETGGILAHGTVLSREYGIPAVTSVKNATRLIREGDLISVDGSRGIVTVASALPEEVSASD